MAASTGVSLEVGPAAGRSVDQRGTGPGPGRSRGGEKGRRYSGTAPPPHTPKAPLSTSGASPDSRDRGGNPSKQPESDLTNSDCPDPHLEC